MDQESARSLAREIGARATALGVNAPEEDNPSIALLAKLCDDRGVALHDVLACC
jgi:hypothetical protein